MKNALRLAATVFCIGIVASTPPAAGADSFVFTAIPDEDEARLHTRFGKLARYLSEALGVEVRYAPVKSYEAAVTAFRNDQVQLAWFGGLSGVQARRLVPDSRAIAQGAEDRAFVTYFIAHAQTGLAETKEFPAAIAGKTFTFGAKGSTSGRLMPEFYIRQAFGKPPEEVFARVGFSGDHSRTIALVQSGAYDVGAVNYTVWENQLKEKRIDPAQVRVIWRTPPYPDYHWTIRGDVDERFGRGFADKVSETLLGIKDPQVLGAFPRSAFVSASGSDYAPIEETAKSIGLID
jgi:phosphonate transport system substrate-binding protein